MHLPVEHRIYCVENHVDYHRQYDRCDEHERVVASLEPQLETND